MEVCKRFDVTTLGDFQLVDTPGPDEAGQVDNIMTKVKEILRDADAIICVMNGKQLRNQSQASITELTRGELIQSLRDTVLRWRVSFRAARCGDFRHAFRQRQDHRFD